jgi:hypothetical protein
MELSLSHAPITTRRPGTVLVDFDRFLTYVQNNSPLLIPKTNELPSRCVTELNDRLSNPLRLHRKTHHLDHYPHLQAFYALSRALGLLKINVDEQNRRILTIDSDRLIQWQDLNPTEKYCNLLSTWLLRSGLFHTDHTAYSNHPYIIKTIVNFFLIHLQDKWVIDSHQPMDLTLHKVGWSHLALLELFGLVNIQETSSSKRWLISEISATTLGWQTVDLFRQKSILIAQECTDLESYHPLFYQTLRALYPAWQVYLPPPTTTRIDGLFTFKVLLTKNRWCRIQLSGIESLNTLAKLIFKTFGIDRQWVTFYRLTFMDGYGLFKTLFPDKPLVLHILVNDLHIIPGDSLVLSYDFDELWTIEVRLEKIEPSEDYARLLQPPRIMTKQGKMSALKPFKPLKSALRSQDTTPAGMQNSKINKKCYSPIQTSSLPGTILKDFDYFLTYLEKNSPILTDQAGWLPSDCVAELNEQMSHRLCLNPRIIQPFRYPGVNALYLLSRSLGLLQIISKYNRRYLILNKKIETAWQTLNPTEKYFNLMSAWLLRCNPLLIERLPHPRFPNVFLDIVKFFLLYLKKVWMPYSQPKPYSPLDRLQLHNLALLEMFGLVYIQDNPSAPQKRWLISQISPTPFGKQLMALFHQNLNLVMYHPDYPEADRRKLFYKMIQPRYPEWQHDLNPTTPSMLIGAHFFKVSLTKTIWCRIRMSGTEPIEVLTDLIFEAFRMDSEFHYHCEFRFTDRYGKFRRFPVQDSPDDENPEPEIEAPCVGHFDILPGDSVVFVYDDDEVWMMDVQLEKIEDTWVNSPCKILEQHGQGPIVDIEEDGVIAAREKNEFDKAKHFRLDSMTHLLTLIFIAYRGENE